MQAEAAQQLGIVGQPALAEANQGQHTPPAAEGRGEADQLSRTPKAAARQRGRFSASAASALPAACGRRGIHLQRVLQLRKAGQERK